MRLNLGCGGKKLPGWVNVDKYPVCGPDQVVDLERFPWPWPDDSADEVLLEHVLEHLGASTEVYLGIIKELYRVCRDGAAVRIEVPHPRHDNFLGDPTHVRPIIPESLLLFSQAANREWLAQGVANTPLGLYIGVDFALASISFSLEQPWKERFERKDISTADLRHAILTYNNVVKQIDVVMHAVKPAGRTSSGANKDSAPVTAAAATQPAGSNA
jgi:hypothetical protein